MSAAGAATFNSSVTLGSTLKLEGSLGDWAVDSQGVVMTFSRPTASYLRATDSGGYLIFQTGGSNTALTLNSNQTASFEGQLSAKGGLIVNGGSTVINELGADLDFRIESVNVDHAFFVEGSSNGRIGLGESSPNHNLDIKGSTAVSMELNGGNGNSKNIYFTQGGTTQGKIRTVGDAMEFGIGGSATEVFRISADGVSFNGSTGAANSLNDYEEVTFNAVLRGSTSEPSNLLQAIGKATKIGRVVQYSIGFENVYTGGYAGAINIYGLPFANKGARAMGSMVGYLGLTFTDDQAFSVIEVNGTTLSLKSVSSNSVWNNCTHNAGSGRYFWLTGTYVTT
jgi:hypothetical protein